MPNTIQVQIIKLPDESYMMSGVQFRRHHYSGFVVNGKRIQRDGIEDAFRFYLHGNVPLVDTQRINFIYV